MNELTLRSELTRLIGMCAELRASYRTDTTPYRYQSQRTNRLDRMKRDAAPLRMSTVRRWDDGLATRIKMLGSLLAQRLGAPDTWTEDLEECLRTPQERHPSRAEALLQVLVDMLDHGCHRPFRDSVVSEIYGDLLDQADHLVGKGWVTAGLVTMGAALELHLNEMNQVQASPLENARAGKVNDFLKRENAYDSAQHKQIQTWLDLRNAAAHPRHESHGSVSTDKSRAIAAIEQVRDFRVRYPTL